MPSPYVASSEAAAGRSSFFTRWTSQMSPSNTCRICFTRVLSPPAWSWTTDRPTASAVLPISCAVCSPKTPTRATVSGTGAKTSAARGTLSSRGPPAKITPTYAAPRATACSASTARVRPQNLISATRAPSHARQPPDCPSRIARCRHRGPHEHRIGTGARDALHVLATCHRTLGHDHDRVGDLPEQPLGGGRVNRQRLEIATVHADHRRANGQRTLQLFGISNLDEALEVQLAGCVCHALQRVVRQCSHDQEGRRRSGGLGFQQLDRIDVKVL